MPNEPDVQCETNVQAKEIEVRGLGEHHSLLCLCEHEVQNIGRSRISLVKPTSLVNEI